MGEVYKAKDTRLNRTVAVKVLPEHVAAHPDSKHRFEREAKALAALSHPHICPVFDVGRQDGIDFLVMEYLDGETLDRRLATGALPLERAMQIAIQVVDALAAAHRAGIVHRDLKPGNIMLTKSGARLLDFGLAKAGAVSAVADSHSILPTTPPNLTAQGMILGTFHYMAPELLDGQDADARSDIFAFGAVMYELFTGKKPFTGNTQASLFGAILRDDPPAVSTLQPLVPPSLDRIVTKCLAKDPDRRWQSARDLHDELKWIAEAVLPTTRPGASTGSMTAPAAAARPGGLVMWLAAVLGIAVVGAVAWIALRSPTAPLRVSRLMIAPTGAATPSVGGNDRDVAITPDGTRVVYVGNNGTQLFVRPLDQLEATVLATGAPRGIFVSPNGQWIGYADGTGLLKKVAITGGPAITITRLDGTGPRGATWLPDDTIVFSTNSPGALRRVSANGGSVAMLTHTERGEIGHVFPEVLPDGHTVLFTIAAAGGGTDQGQIATLDLVTGARKVILKGGSHAHYVAPGYLVYAAGESLRAVGFDMSRLETRGP